MHKFADYMLKSDQEVGMDCEEQKEKIHPYMDEVLRTDHSKYLPGLILRTS